MVVGRRGRRWWVGVGQREGIEVEEVEEVAVVGAGRIVMIGVEVEAEVEVGGVSVEV